MVPQIQKLLITITIILLCFCVAPSLGRNIVDDCITSAKKLKQVIKLNILKPIIADNAKDLEGLKVEGESWSQFAISLLDACTEGIAAIARAEKAVPDTVKTQAAKLHALGHMLRDLGKRIQQAAGVLKRPDCRTNDAFKYLFWDSADCPRVCRTCYGEGKPSLTDPRVCNQCRGKGTVGGDDLGGFFDRFYPPPKQPASDGSTAAATTKTSETPVSQESLRKSSDTPSVRSETSDMSDMSVVDHVSPNASLSPTLNVSLPSHPGPKTLWEVTEAKIREAKRFASMPCNVSQA